MLSENYKFIDVGLILWAIFILNLAFGYINISFHAQLSTHNRLLYIRYPRLHPQSSTPQIERRKSGHPAPAGNQQYQSQ